MCCQYYLCTLLHISAACTVSSEAGGLLPSSVFNLSSRSEQILYNIRELPPNVTEVLTAKGKSAIHHILLCSMSFSGQNG